MGGVFELSARHAELAAQLAAPAVETEDFRKIGKEAGLIKPFNYRGTRFHFDLNDGEVITTQNLKQVWEVVKLARAAAQDGQFGEHSALLQLVVETARLGGDALVFQRPYLVGAAREPEKWRSLQQILEKAGYDMSEIYRERTPPA